MEQKNHWQGQELSGHRYVPALRSQTCGLPKNEDNMVNKIEDITGKIGDKSKNNRQSVEELKNDEQTDNKLITKKEVLIGFYGIEKYEMILYLSRILKQLGKKVLVLDCSENGALDAGICYFRDQPVIYGELQEYRGIDYLNYTIHDSASEITYEEYTAFYNIRKDYDFVLMDFGFRRGHPLLTACDRCFLISDQQRHNILRIKEAALECCVPFTIVLRDVLACKVSLDYFTDFISVNQKAEDLMILYRNEEDTKWQIQCQYGQAINFQKLSRETKEFLKQTVMRLLPDHTKAEIWKALKQAERGKK